jgi:methylmalonyl-CoA mutase N-terminal domain/subunit
MNEQPSKPQTVKDNIEVERSRWEEEALSKAPLRAAKTDSDLELKPLYTPLDVADEEYLDKLGFPGQYPFTRGVYPSMYRGQLWTIRQYAGLGTAEETNARYRFLLDRGQTGLSVALDLPTQMGYDSDDPLAEEEVGVVGVAIDTLADMEILFDAIPLDQISVHFTVNAPAAVILAMYLVVAERRGIAFDRLSGTLQNDILKEYIARNTYIFPPQPSLRLVGDVITYCYQQVPRFNPISITGYHAREAGASAIQEVAYTLAAAITYVETMLARGISVDAFAPRLSFHFSSQRDLFEETCKIRAARRLWARLMKERFGSNNPRSQMMRYFNGGSGASLAHAEPLNNIVRGTLQCLAGVMAGAQACHVPSYDEAYAIPSKEAALLSVRTQQIIAYESGVPNVIDPLAGSYFVEALTERLESEIEALLRQIEEAGGLVAAIERGDIRRAIFERAYALERQVENGERVIVGVNAFTSDGKSAEMLSMPSRTSDSIVLERQIERLSKIKAGRNRPRVESTLQALHMAANQEENLMPFILEAVRAYATIGEIVGVLRTVFGEYRMLSLW